MNKNILIEVLFVTGKNWKKGYQSKATGLFKQVSNIQYYAVKISDRDRHLLIHKNVYQIVSRKKVIIMYIVWSYFCKKKYLYTQNMCI